LKKNILFVINPVSGGKTKLKFPQIALKYLDKEKFHAEFIFTERPGHAFEIASSVLNSDTDIIVAVGGDGTINEIASAVESTNKSIGIIPCGSGNGLARSLGIPMKEREAIIKLNDLRINTIDTGIFNGKKFFNMAGIGFDAHISTIFAQDVRRGFRGYVKTAVTEISKYRAQHYYLEINGTIYERDAFMISIANSSQFGNNAHIAPFASLEDGILDICVIKPFPLYQFPGLGYRMFNKSTHKSKYVEIIKSEKIRIIRDIAGAVHLDGEPTQMDTELNISIKPLSLSVLN
jgi:diacylglycerol kinase (ATP)